MKKLLIWLVSNWISKIIIQEFLRLNQEEWICDGSTFTVSFTYDNYQNPIIIKPQSKKIAVLYMMAKLTKDKYRVTPHWFNIDINLIF